MKYKKLWILSYFWYKANPCRLFHNILDQPNYVDTPYLTKHNSLSCYFQTFRNYKFWTGSKLSRILWNLRNSRDCWFHKTKCLIPVLQLAYYYFIFMLLSINRSLKCFGFCYLYFSFNRIKRNLLKM